ncbi:hypothetical protein [Bacteroides faecium]|uniref:Uncharacterized protein n=1 Tax=Bacteroides faecium TaxID=2715212 RepID=A0A6H0KUK5_9BACE|nr:hypothetical protein [Bacteroides faecium]QIU97120.1 hypothetical protein BacF7301_24520 [Bacteroides faecium]
MTDPHSNKLNISTEKTSKDNILDTLEKQLNSLKQQYIDILKKQIIIPKRKTYKISGYFTAEVLNELYLIENKIAIINKELGKDDHTWCSTKKHEILKRYHQPRSKHLFQVAWKIGLPVIILLWGLGTLCSYISSKDAIDKFKYSMNVAKSLESQENFNEAMTTYQKAKDEYDGSFNNSSYKHEAKEHMIICFNMFKTKCESLIVDEHYNEAKLQMHSLHQEIINKNPKIAEDIKSITDRLSDIVSEKKEQLILNIFTNGGHLDVEGKKSLAELLKFAPDDYWLIFIKNKEK